MPVPNNNIDKYKSIQQLKKLDHRIPEWTRSDLAVRNCPVCNLDSYEEAYCIRPDGLSLQVCKTCSTVYVSPAPSEKSLESFYQQYHTKYFSHIHSIKNSAILQTRRKPKQDIRINRLLNFISLKNKRVLDVGCGRGKIMHLLSAYDADVFGFDPDIHAINYSKSQGLVQIFAGSIDAVNYNELFDVIILKDIIEHPLNPSALVEECVKRLRPKGLILVWTPNPAYGMKRSCRTTFRIHLEHMQYIGERAMAYLAKNNNLEIIDLSFFGRPYLNGIKSRYFLIAFCRSLKYRLLEFMTRASQYSWMDRFPLIQYVRGNYSILAILQKNN